MSSGRQGQNLAAGNGGRRFLESHFTSLSLVEPGEHDVLLMDAREFRIIRVALDATHAHERLASLQLLNQLAALLVQLDDVRAGLGQFGLQLGKHLRVNRLVLRWVLRTMTQGPQRGAVIGIVVVHVDLSSPRFSGT